jgi:transcriptional regulator with XRE-family HTH domain
MLEKQHIDSTMSILLEQLKKRRIALGLKQNDMLLRIGISRQQYQRLESKGNPRLDTLELISKGLKSELMLISQEKLLAVKAVLEGKDSPYPAEIKETTIRYEENALANNPWLNLLDDE